MEDARYLVVGSSHAALEAVAAIRMHDPDGSLALITRDGHLPYSPTVLPYVVSGRSAPDRIFLRNEEFFAERHVVYRPGQTLVRLHPQRNTALLADGSEVRYEKLLLATGAAPTIPPIPGLDKVQYHVLRTLDDALKLKAAIGASRQAVVLGGGLVGMHAAENLVMSGAKVTIIEMQDQLLGAYFDRQAAGFIGRAFIEHGARIFTGRRVVGLAPSAQGATVSLEGGGSLETDLLLVATGVKPDLGYLADSGINCAAGIIVNNDMGTNIGNIWAAGDCAQAKDFYKEGTTMNAILPDATEQGRIAGMAMAGDPSRKDYLGGVPLNTYHFFGRHAISVGTGVVPTGGIERLRVDEAAGRYLRVIFQDGRLLGIFGIGEFFDSGVMWQLILRRADLTDSIERLVADPLTVGREFMSRLWR